MGTYDSGKICISVIMPSLNVVQYIRECIESVLTQTLQDIEVLCVDAGSTDGTLNILEEYASKDKRVRVIKSEKKSYGYQLNIGIREAKGEYIGIVETDDYIDAAMYESLYLHALGRTQTDFVKGGYFQFAELNSRKIFAPYNRNRLTDIYNEFICLKDDREKGILDLNHIWSGIYRREFLLEKGIKLHETLGSAYQDLSFSLLVGLLANTGIYIDERYYFYRIDNADSSVKSNSKWHCVIDEFEYVMQELRKRKVYSEELKTLVWMQKPGIYFWNLQRLPQQERKAFLIEIQQELQEYERNEGYYRCLNDEQKKSLECLKSRKAFEDYDIGKRELIHKFEHLFKRIKEGKKFVLVSAGRFSERLIFLQNALNMEFIEAVADNDATRWEQVWNKYILSSVPEAVRKYREDEFIIANKKHSDKIQNQLENMGVSSDKIFAINDMLSLEEMLELVLR